MQVNSESSELLKRLLQEGNGMQIPYHMTVERLHPLAESVLQTLHALGLIEGYEEILGPDETGCLQITKVLVVQINNHQLAFLGDLVET